MSAKALCSSALSLLLFLPSVLAYTGGYSVLPSIPGGPGNTNVDRFDIDTTGTNPQTISVGMGYVEAVVVQTSSGVTGNLLVKEEPTGDSPTFSFTVQKKIEDELVQATVFFWAPDTSPLVITHQHANDPPTQVYATKVTPNQQDSDGNVLWYFTTTTFSEFAIKPDYREPRPFPVAAAILLALISLSACVMLRRQ